MPSWLPWSPSGRLARRRPNYAVAKFLQRWRAIYARHVQGCVVSITNGPATKTVSVMHSAQMAFVMERVHLVPPNRAYEPDTVRRLLFLLMVRDIRSRQALAQPGTALPHVLDLCEENAWHGGMWLSPYSMQSVGVYLYARHYGSRLAGLLLLGAVAYFAFLRG